MCFFFFTVETKQNTPRHNFKKVQVIFNEIEYTYYTIHYTNETMQIHKNKKVHDVRKTQMGKGSRQMLPDPEEMSADKK